MAGYDFRDDDDDDDGYSTKHCGCCRRLCTPASPGGDQTNQSCCNRKCSSNGCLNGVQILLLLLAVGAGVGLGTFLRMTPPFDEPELHPRLMWYLWFPAELLTRAMSLLVTPLLVSGVVSGAASMGRAGRVVLRAIAFYLGTTTLACAEGLAFVFLIKPAANMTVPKVNATGPTVNTIDTTLDIFRNLVPDNIITPIFQSVTTNISWEIKDANAKNLTEPIEVLTLGHRDHVNVLGLTVLSVLIGLGINHVGESARPLSNLFSASYEVIMAVIKVILWLLPVGVLFMVATTVVLLSDDPVTYLVSMTWFLVTVTSGLAVHFLFVMPLLLLLLARTNPFRHLALLARALVTAFATNNSNMALPVTMGCLEEAGYAGPVVRLLCPVGAAINLDGRCLYDTVAVLFLASLRGVATGPAEIATAGLASVLLSVGVPSAMPSLVVWTILMDCLGLPPSDVFLLLPFDWLLGRLRTVVNVWGDSIGVAIVCRFSQDDLREFPPEGAIDVDNVSEPSAMGMVMNGSYRPIDSTPSRRKSYTLTVENESGDIVKVSKV